MKPIDKESLNLLVMAWNVVAKSLFMQGKTEEALDNFSLALQLNPDDVVTNFNLSLALAVDGRFVEAARYCSEALRLKPDYRGARQHLQQIQQQMELNKLPIDRPFGKEIANVR
jgi:Flp pilus assembly protein TadD